VLSSYLRVLACIARADGVIASEEIAAIERAAEGILGDRETVNEVRSILDASKPVDFDALLREYIHRITEANTNATPSLAAHLAELVRDCYVIAAVDGAISPEEVAMIDRLLELAGISVRRRATLHQWAEAAAQQTLDGVGLFFDCLTE